jgi:hypothetical protein
MAELFRFVLARPAKKDTRSIYIRSQRESVRDHTLREASDTETSLAAVALPSSTSQLFLFYGENIRKLQDSLELSEVDAGRVRDLKAQHVRQHISDAFSGQDLEQLTQNEAWERDRKLLDTALWSIWESASDPAAVGPRLTLQRQLYNLVEQAVTSSESRQQQIKFVLKGLERPRSLLPLISNLPSRPTVPQSGGASGTSTGSQTALTAGEQATHIAALNEVLEFLNSPSVYQYAIAQKPEDFYLWSWWIPTLSAEAQTALEAFGIVPNNADGAEGDDLKDNRLTFIYDSVLREMKASRKAAASALSFKSGLYSIGPFNLELNNPFGQLTASEAAQEGSSGDWLPAQEPSKVKPTGVGDLLVVRDHVWEYVGGEIGAIENVLKSEKLVRETKRLDRSETVVFSSTETTNEEERDQQTTSRFALNNEASNIIKSDNALKAGVTTTAYGPSVTVKGDLSFATTNSSETANRVASQFSQDITSRAASRVIEKTFASTKQTSISQFQEHFRHEFNNIGENKSNISGVYQWVNKVSQCQMYNYGKRLLIDITIPEPAAFLMTTNSNRGPLLEKPRPLKETAADINEATYAEIAARYQTTGIKPPATLLYNFSQSFKAEGGGTAAQHGSVTLDVKLPVGYLAFSAMVQVGVRSGDVNRVANTYISVGGVHQGSGGVDDDKEASQGNVTFFDQPIGGTLAVAITQNTFLAMSGTIQVRCIRDPKAYATWQQTTYDAIVTAYTKLKTDYDRSVSEAAISDMNVVEGNNPLENTSVISNELKKACISFITAQNFKVFGTIETDPIHQIPEVNNFDKALVQGRYAEFFEKAFEWENMQYLLYPYFWGARSSWRDRVGFHSPDPAFSNFVKAGAAHVTLPARLGHSLEVIHLLDTGKLWQEGPVSTLVGSPYYSVAQEILAAEASPSEVKVSAPWYTVVPTDLVRLRHEMADVLPRFKLNQDGVWVEKQPDEE